MGHRSLENVPFSKGGILSMSRKIAIREMETVTLGLDGAFETGSAGDWSFCSCCGVIP